MADPINYSGVTYDDAYYRQDQESMYDYMKRLASQRAGGILGGGGMLNTPQAEITSTDLGMVKENCAAGYVWNGKACVPVQQNGGGEGTGVTGVPETTQQKLDRMMGRTVDPAIALAAIPAIGGLLLNAADSGRKNDLLDALEEQGATKAERDFMKDNEMLMANVMYRDPTLGFTGGLDRSKQQQFSVEGIVGNLFGMNKTPQEFAVDYAQARAVNPALFSQTTNIAAAQIANPNYLGTATDPNAMLSQGSYGFDLNSDGGDSSYVASYGGTYDTSGMSDATKAGLDAVSSGMFNTPSYYEDEY